MVTIKEIANMLGMSTTTVSNVIHGKTSEVSQKTVERVQKILEEYEYVPNMNARNLAQNESKIIGIAVKARKDKYVNILADPFYGPLLGAVEAAVRSKGYFMMIYISHDINELMSHVSTWNVDGLILSGMLSDDFVRVRSRYKKPVVLIDSYMHKEITKYVNVGLEDRQGAYEMTRYLISQGHSKIGFLTDNLEGVDYYRFQGFEQAMAEAGISVGEESLLLFRPGEDERESSLKEIYCELGKYTVVMCMSDYYAAMLMNFLHDQGMQIPEDISITGFDDNMIGQMMRPALTTVSQDIELKGRTAVDALISMIKGEVLNRDIKLPVKLVIRDSVMKIAQD